MQLITLQGQTSSGKSDLAVDLAKELSGMVWIVGSDSRQIYKKLDLGSGKVEGEWKTSNSPSQTKNQIISFSLKSKGSCPPLILGGSRGDAHQGKVGMRSKGWQTKSGGVVSQLNFQKTASPAKAGPPQEENFKKFSKSELKVYNKQFYYYKDIPHFLIDYVGPDNYYSLSDFIEDWVSLFKNAKKLPDYVILTGGTGLYEKAIIENYQLGRIKPEFEEIFNKEKGSLENLELEELQNLAKKSDLNESDFHNPRRLVNWILRKKGRGKWFEKLEYPEFEKIHRFAIKIDQQELKEKIYNRLIMRDNQGMVNEVRELMKILPTQRLLDFGLEYRIITQYLLGDIDGKEWTPKLNLEIWHYAKRQMTWLKKQKVTWVTGLGDIFDCLDIQ